MKNVTVHISTSSIIRVILVLVGAYALWFLKDIVLILLASLVIASAVEPFASALVKKRLPRVVAVLFVYLIFFASFFGIILYVLPSILTETKDLLNQIPGYLNSINAGTGANVSDTFKDLSAQVTSITNGIKDGNYFGVISLVFGGVASFVFILVFSFYFAISEKGIYEFLRVITPKEKEDYIISLWKRSQTKIGLWMQGQLLLAVLIGVLVYLGLMILNVPNALPLAVLAGLFELIPVFGPILSAVPAVAIAMVTGGWSLAIMVVGLYLIIQQFENNLIYPLVVTKVVGVPPVLSILALLIGAKLAGILGILLSVPIAAILQEVFDDWGKSKTHIARTSAKSVARSKKA